MFIKQPTLTSYFPQKNSRPFLMEFAKMSNHLSSSITHVRLMQRRITQISVNFCIEDREENTPIKHLTNVM